MGTSSILTDEKYLACITQLHISASNKEILSCYVDLPPQFDMKFREKLPVHFCISEGLIHRRNCGLSNRPFSHSRCEQVSTARKRYFDFFAGCEFRALFLPSHHAHLHPDPRHQAMRRHLPPPLAAAAAAANNNNTAEGDVWIVPEDPAPAGLPPGPGNTNVLTTRKHNNVKELQGSLFEFIWRKQHDMNLWNGILWTLKQVKYQE